MLEASFPSRVFRGVRFVLLGFDPVTESQIRFKLVSGGGVDVGKYSKTCTHVIVDKIAYDDPVCVAARNDRKIVVTALWVEHSADIGLHADSTSVLYRPLKDLNGIPGAENLIMCLTGYLRQDRDDIMTMVALMGAEFSKPLVANKVTHLICYKFEGEKYELAKKMGTIKLVNHRWLEDCLKNWVLLPEDNYNLSGFELEMMETEAKDSEEENEDSKLGQYGETNRNRSPLSSKFSMVTTQGLSKSVREASNAFPHSTDPQVLPKVNNGKDSVSIPGNKNKSDQGLTFRDVDDNINCRAPDVSRNSTSYQLLEKHVKTSDCKNTDFPKADGFQDLGISGTTNSSDKQPDLHDRTESNKLGSNMRSPSPSASAEVLAHSNEKHGTVSKSKGQKDYNLPRILDECLGREGNNGETTSSKVENASEGIKTTCVESSGKENDFNKGDEPINLLPQKRRNEASSIKSKSRKVTADAKLSANDKSRGIKVTPLVDEPPKADGYLSVGKDDVNNSCLASKSAASTSNSVAFVEAFSRNANSESAQRDNAYQNSSLMAAKGLSTFKINGKSDITSFGMGQVVDNDAEQHNISKDFEYSTPGNKKSPNEESTGLTNLDLSNEESNKLTRKSPRKKSVAKKSLGVRPKLGSTNKQKKSVSLNKTVLQGERVSFSSGSKERATCDAEKHQTSPQTLDVNKSMDSKKVSEDAEDAGGRIDFLDEETEAPDDKCEYAIGMEVDEELVPLPNKAERKAEEKSEANHEVAKCEEEMRPRNGSNEPEKQNSSSVVDSTSKLKVKHQAKKRLGGKTKTTKVGKELPKSEEDVTGEKIPKETRHEAEIESLEQMSRPADVCENKAIARNKSKDFIEEEKENRPIDEESDLVDGRSVGNTTIESSVRPAKINSAKNGQNPSISESKMRAKTEAACFILSGHRLQRKEFQQVIKRLKGRVCRDSHQWSYQATHFIAPDPLRRTEKFFAAAASGRWILKTDFLTASSQAGKFLPEEPYEWHKNGLSEDGAINMEAPRKWRLLKERTGHGAFYGMRIVVYGDCIIPPLDTLKRVVKAGDGTILATSPPYTRFLGSEIDYAIVSPGMPRVDMWVQEFLKHEIPCVLADYLVEYVCKPGFPLERHVLYGTRAWAERSYSKLKSKEDEIIEDIIPPKDSNDDDDDDIICQVCGSRDRGDVMLICGDERGSVGCGIGTHIDCCDPPFAAVPEEDWFCPKCSSIPNCSNKPSKKKKGVLSSSKRK